LTIANAAIIRGMRLTPMFFRATTSAQFPKAAEVAGWDPCGLTVGAMRPEKPYRISSPEATLNSDDGGPGG
jgi:hypothetical protein